jgi:hypothetical protein
MDTGSGSSTIPTYDSGFPVDWALRRAPASTSDFISYQRLLGLQYVVTNSTSGEATSDKAVWDSNVGFFKTDDSSKQAWMFRRGQGFDTLGYIGDDVAGRQIVHNLGPNVPEMIWIRKMGGGEWIVGHHGVNNGTNPWHYEMLLHDTRAEGASANKFNNTAPTSRTFTVGANTYVNATNDKYLALLFSSVNGISKVGSYSGSGVSGNAQNIGFQPRFLFVKCTSTAASWVVWDSLRGVGNYLLLNSNNAQGSASAVTFTSTGFTLTGTSDSSNGSGQKYIFFAHA